MPILCYSRLPLHFRGTFTPLHSITLVMLLVEDKTKEKKLTLTITDIWKTISTTFRLIYDPPFFNSEKKSHFPLNIF